MYIDKIFEENVGPIEKVNIECPFNENGLPKPIVFVGENGSGKSTLLSNIVDSLYSIASKKYENAMQYSDGGNGQQYYKVISPTEIKIGKDYMYSYIVFRNTSPVQYVFKSGKLSTTKFKEKKDLCGPNKINIIEGSQGDKIHSFSDETIDNYALPKMEFAKYVSKHPDKFDFSGFVEVFRVIKEILAD